MTTITEIITEEQSRKIINAAISYAEQIGVTANIAVLDTGAHLKAFIRMDGAVLGSIDVAIGKARTAALFSISSEAVWDYCKPGAPAHNLEASNGSLMPFAGGLPIFNTSGVMIGAIGVSGGAVTQDSEIAEAALSAFNN
ncbi:heme-binding protein [Acinetobacter lactucae]|uniref:GlcG/HbpS family heme-binding protein n=1 Tax=Acinetobacter lactucae TaxID=1785128 RepID=UPI00358DD86E